MDRNQFENYWSYYLNLENMFAKTEQYISHSVANQKAYSNEFAKIILLSCSEIDSLLKIVCIHLNIPKDRKYFNMSSYAKALLKISSIKKIAFSTLPTTSNKENGIVVFPFKDLNSNKEYAGLSWWSDYQKIKHDRHKNATFGNLQNSALSLAAHYIILRIMIDLLEERSGKEYVKEHSHSNFWIPVI
ncbi:hypothetical protein IGI39_003013 [Enterococcus sp. AZ135]|uniref:hypothetical protein n=1 Tax=unclassified Enterococcus TaxID=2608891 RepID=UPI003F26C76E